MSAYETEDIGKNISHLFWAGVAACVICGMIVGFSIQWASKLDLGAEETPTPICYHWECHRSKGVTCQCLD